MQLFFVGLKKYFAFIGDKEGIKRKELISTKYTDYFADLFVQESNNVSCQTFSVTLEAAVPSCNAVLHKHLK